MDALKTKVIKDFKNFLLNLNRGYKTDYSMILNNIMFIETHGLLNTNLDYIYEYLINN